MHAIDDLNFPEQIQVAIPVKADYNIRCHADQLDQYTLPIWLMFRFWDISIEWSMIGFIYAEQRILPFKISINEYLKSSQSRIHGKVPQNYSDTSCCSWTQVSRSEIIYLRLGVQPRKFSVNSNCEFFETLIDFISNRFSRLLPENIEHIHFISTFSCIILLIFF